MKHVVQQILYSLNICKVKLPIGCYGYGCKKQLSWILWQLFEDNLLIKINKNNSFLKYCLNTFLKNSIKIICISTKSTDKYSLIVFYFTEN